MRIVYLLYWNPYLDSGVLEKVRRQIAQWSKEGFQVEPVFVHPVEDGHPKIQGHVLGRRLKFLPGSLRPFVSKITSSLELLDHLKAIKPNVIYLRQTYWYPGLLRVLSHFKVCIELNTIDLFEIRKRNFFLRQMALIGREKLNHSMTGFVAVSEEIEGYYRQYPAESIVIANAANNKAFEDLLYSRQSTPQVLFIGTPGHAWHGLDKLLWLIQECPEFHFHIVGYDHSEEIVNATFYGFVPFDDLKSIYSKVSVGIGSLALHRIDVHEASPLKVREYVAARLPCVIAHKDTDLGDSEFVLNIGNMESNVIQNLQSIKDFVIHSHVLDRSKVFEGVRKKLSFEVKERKRLRFLISLTD